MQERDKELRHRGLVKASLPTSPLPPPYEDLTELVLNSIWRRTVSHLRLGVW